MAIRLGGRARYIQGSVDATYSRATSATRRIPRDGVYDTGPNFVNTNLDASNNPFKMMRYGLLAELSYTF